MAAARALLLAGAVELMLLVILVGAFAILRITHPDLHRGDLRFFSWHWGLGQMCLLCLGLLAAHAAARRVFNRHSASVMILAAIAVIQGLALLGVKGVEWAGWGEPQVFVVATVPPMPLTTGARTAAPAMGDPVAGAKAYAVSCAACHGARGEGLANTAPALKGSEFIRVSGIPQIAAVIAGGRTATDPASRTGKAMPPRGGNPFLSDADISNIISFLRSELPGEARAAVSPPRWVVPPPPAGPAGLAQGFLPAAPTWQLPPGLRAEAPTSAERLFAPLAAVMTGIHTLHVLVAIAIMGALLWAAYDKPAATSTVALARLGRTVWLTAAVLWTALFPFLYLI